jgi:hypothetical protein
MLLERERMEMRRTEPNATSSGSAPGRPRERFAIRWADVGLSAVLVLTVAVPTLAVEEDWHGRPMIDQATHLWLVAVCLVVGAFLIGGALAGYRRPSAAVLHATTAALVAVVVLLLADVARRLWIVHEGVSLDVAHLWFFGVVGALVISAAGSQLGRRLALGPR